MKLLAILVGFFVLFMAPLRASAALQFRFGPSAGSDAIDASVAPGSGPHFLDLTFIEVGSPVNEMLGFYDVGLLRSQPGLTLLRAERPDNFVFTDAGAYLQTFVQAPDRLLVGGGIGSGPPVNVMTGAKAARVYYTIDPSTAPGVYRITIDPITTAFNYLDPNCSMCYPPPASDDGVILVTPEPSGLALVALGGVLAIRRRRTPPALE